MGSRRAVGVIAVVCAIIAPLIALWRSGVIGAAPSGSLPSQFNAVRRDAQLVYGAATFGPLIESPDADQLGELLAGGFVENHAGIADERIELLRRHMSEFLFERFCQPDASRYIQWRMDHGYGLRDRDELFDRGPIGRAHIAITTTEDPMALSDQEVAARLADVTLETMFSAAWSYGITDRAGSATPQRVATTRDWLGITISRASEPKGGGRPLLTGEHGPDLWYGTSAASPLQWWQPGVLRDSLKGPDGRITFADVGVLAGFADASFKPIVCTFAWDERNARWWLLHMTIQNSPGTIAGTVY